MQHSIYNGNQQQHEEQRHNHNNNNNNNQNQSNENIILSLTSSSSSSSLPTATITATATTPFMNTAKLPIETVKLLIASVSRHPNLWIRSSTGQKRCDINALWQQVSQEVHLPANICRIKWGHLRDNFRKVFIRNTLSEEAPTTWRFYNDMRFMEAAVAENVMRQHRLKDQSLYWQEFHQNKQKLKNNISHYFDLRDNQLNYAELSTFLEHNQQEPFPKRIKLEGQNASTVNFLDENSPTISIKDYQVNDPYIERSNQLNGNHDGDDDDDDDFDEDAASSEHNFPNISNAAPSRTSDIINDRNAMKLNDKTFPLTNPIIERKSFIQPSKLETTNLNSDIMLPNDANEQDSDRMFLLSLLPYLHRVAEHRKLKVRQRLQSVLIEEFG